MNIFGFIGSLIGAVVAVAAAVVTGGSSAVLVAGAVCACVACAASIGSTACSMVAATTDDPELKKKLSQASFGLGIGAAIVGITGAICSGVGTIRMGQVIAENISNLFKTGSALASALTQIAQGSLQISQGVGQLKLANLQESLANKEMQLEKLDASIEEIEAFIKMLMSKMQTILELFLKTEQAAASEMIRVADMQLSLSQEVRQHA